MLALGLWGLLFPPAALRADMNTLLTWAGALMAITYTAYSVVSVAHQAWGARLGGNEAQRSRVVAWREALSLLGVLLAAVLPWLWQPPAVAGWTAERWQWQLADINSNGS